MIQGISILKILHRTFYLQQIFFSNVSIHRVRVRAVIVPTHADTLEWIDVVHHDRSEGER